MSLNTAILVNGWWQILLIVTVLIFIKTLFIYLASITLRSSHRISVQLRFLLSQGSEFAFVVFSLPHISQSLGAEISSMLISSVALSMALTPPIAQWGYRFAEKLEKNKLQSSSLDEAKSQDEDKLVIILGMGDVGRCVADALEAHSISYKAIEMDNDRFVHAFRDGYNVFFGDGTDLRLRETIEMAHANTLVITKPRIEIAKEITPISRERYPNLQRIASVDNEDQRHEFEALDIQVVIDRSFPKGLDIAAVTIRAQKIDEKKISAWMKRQQNRALDEKEELSGLSSAFPDRG